MTPVESYMTVVMETLRGAKSYRFPSARSVVLEVDFTIFDSGLERHLEEIDMTLRASFGTTLSVEPYGNEWRSNLVGNEVIPTFSVPSKDGENTGARRKK